MQTFLTHEPPLDNIHQTNLYKCIEMTDDSNDGYYSPDEMTPEDEELSEDFKDFSSDED